MENPVTKGELLKGIKEQRRILEVALKGLTDADMVRSEKPGAWSVKDILAHIVTWEKFFLMGYESGLRGQKLDAPDWSKPGIIDEINQEIYEENKNRSLEDVLTEFRASYERILKTVEGIPEEDMFVPARFDWLGRGTLAECLIGNTSGHYAEHTEMINVIRKNLGK